MLARLESLPGVTSVHVDCTGRYFALEVERDEVVLAVQTALGPSARPLDPADAAAQLEARARGETWYDARGIRGLSYLEGRVLAARLATGVGARAGLDAREAEAVGEPIRRALFAALDRIHDAGGAETSGWLAESWAAIAADLRGRLAGVLEPGRLEAVIEAFLAERPG